MAIMISAIETFLPVEISLKRLITNIAIPKTIHKRVTRDCEALGKKRFAPLSISTFKN